MLKLRYNQKLCFPDFFAKMPIFKNRAYFSVTPIALNDVNIRGGNVIKPSHEKSVPVKSWQCLADKREMSPKQLICDSCILNVCFRKYSTPFYLC